MTWTPTPDDVARWLPERCRQEIPVEDPESEETTYTFGFSPTTYPTADDVTVVIAGIVAEITARVGTVPASCETLARLCASVGAARDVEMAASSDVMQDARDKADRLTARYNSLLEALAIAVAAAGDTNEDGVPDGGGRHSFPPARDILTRAL